SPAMSTKSPAPSSAPTVARGAAAPPPRRSRWQDLRRWFTYDNWWVGKYVELTGNKGHVSGLEFDLKNPYIATGLKSRFLFGTYEAGADKMVRRHVNPDLPVVECGACIGVMSCLVN